MRHQQRECNMPVLSAELTSEYVDIFDRVDLKNGMNVICSQVCGDILVKELDYIHLPKGIVVSDDTSERVKYSNEI